MDSFPTIKPMLILVNSPEEKLAAVLFVVLIAHYLASI
jgi:hypothetical protein